MRVLTDERLLNKVLNNFDECFLDKILEEEIKVRIAGGAVTSVFTGSRINDYDLYFENRDDISRIMPYLLRKSTIEFVTNKAISFHISGQKYQIIHYDSFPTAESIFKDYDFSVNCGSFSIQEEKFELQDNFESTIRSREIEFNDKTKYPILTALRMEKYEKRGYSFDRSTKMKIYMTISEVCINTVGEFVDQIGGYYGKSINIGRMERELLDHSLSNRLRRYTDFIEDVTRNWNANPADIVRISGIEFEYDRTQLIPLVPLRTRA